MHDKFCGRSYHYSSFIHVHKTMNQLDLFQLIQEVFEKIITLIHDENPSVVKLFFDQFPERPFSTVFSNVN